MHPVLYSAYTKKEVRYALANKSVEEQFELVKSTIEFLDKETDKALKAGLNEVAIMKMSQVVMLEEELLVLERIMLKQGVFI